MEALFTQAWNLGGFAVAFVVAMWMLRESFKQRIDELNRRTDEKNDDRKSLLEAVTCSSAAITRAAESNTQVVATLNAMQIESRARTAEILQNVEAMKITLAEHVALAAVTAESAKQAAIAAKVASDAAKVASDSAAVVANAIAKRQMQPTRKKETTITTSMT